MIDGLITEYEIRVAREKAIQIASEHKRAEKAIQIKRGLSICVPIDATDEEIERRKAKFMKNYDIDSDISKRLAPENTTESQINILPIDLRHFGY